MLESIQKVKNLIQCALNHDKDGQDIQDMFEDNNKPIQFILSNEKEYQMIEKVCQKIKSFLKSPLKIEASISSAKMIGIGVATVVGGALVAAVVEQW